MALSIGSFEGSNLKSQWTGRAIARAHEAYTFFATNTTDTQPPIGREPVGGDSVRYRRPDRPRLGRRLFPDRDISLCSRFLHGPGALELSANRRCLSKCGEPSSGVTTLRCNPRDRVPPRRPRASAGGLIVADPSDDGPQRHGQGIDNRWPCCRTHRSIFEAPLWMRWTRRIALVAFPSRAQPQ